MSALTNGHRPRVQGVANGVGGDEALQSPSAKQMNIDSQQATQLFQSLAHEDLANLFSDDAIELPSTPEQATAWALAARLLAASGSGAAQLLPPRQADHVASRACEALNSALEAVLQGPGSAVLTPSQLPDPECIQAMASLAALAATRSGKDASTPADVIDCLLRKAEQCTALALDIGADKKAGSYALRLALSTAANLKPLLERFAASSHVIVQDVAARMQVLLVRIISRKRHQIK